MLNLGLYLGLYLGVLSGNFTPILSSVNSSSPTVLTYCRTFDTVSSDTNCYTNLPDVTKVLTVTPSENPGLGGKNLNV